MKRFHISFILLLISILSYSQVSINMQKENGVYKVPCIVNGLRMKFIFDTGASVVSLSLTEAKFMIENDYITKDDIIGKGKSQIADGSIVENTVVNLKEIKIGGLILNDVQATVIHDFGAPLLLGQSAIQKLGSVTIDGDILTINNFDKETLSENEIENLFDNAKTYYKKGMYASSYECYDKLYKLDLLNDYGLYSFSIVCMMCNKDKQFLKCLQKVESPNRLMDDGINYYNIIGHAYLLNNKFDEAISSFEKAMMYASSDKEKAFIKDLWASACEYNEDFYNASELYAQSLHYKAKELKVTREYLAKDILGILKKAIKV